MGESVYAGVNIIITNRSDGDAIVQGIVGKAVTT